MRKKYERAVLEIERLDDERTICSLTDSNNAGEGEWPSCDATEVTTDSCGKDLDAASAPL